MGNRNLSEDQKDAWKDWLLKSQNGLLLHLCPDKGSYSEFYFADSSMSSLTDTVLNDKNNIFSNSDSDLASDLALDLSDDLVVQIIEAVEDDAENEDVGNDPTFQEILDLVNDDERRAEDKDSEDGNSIISYGYSFLSNHLYLN